jgi:hypothetical protein
MEPKRQRLPLIVMLGSLVAGGFLVIVFGLAVVGAVIGEDDEATTLRRDADACAERNGGDPYSRLRDPYAAIALSPAEAADELGDVPAGLRELYDLRDLYREQKVLGTGYFMALGDDREQAEDWLEGFREGAVEEHATLRPVTLSGHEAMIVDYPKGAGVAGMLECGGLLVVAGDERTARRFWSILAAPPPDDHAPPTSDA